MSFFKYVLIILRQNTKHANFWLGVQVPQGYKNGLFLDNTLGIKPTLDFAFVCIFKNDYKFLFVVDNEASVKCLNYSYQFTLSKCVDVIY